MTIKYFVSYMARLRGDAFSRAGRCMIVAQAPITGIDRIETIEATLRKKNGYEDCTLTGWQRFEAEGEPDAIRSI